MSYLSETGVAIKSEEVKEGELPPAPPEEETKTKEVGEILDIAEAPAEEPRHLKRGRTKQSWTEKPKTKKKT